MSEEELKAIENLKHIIKHWKPDNEEDELANIEYNSIKIAVNLIEKQQNKIENIKKEVQEHIAFENRLKRDNTEPDLFNQGRFYVANNIKDILNGKEII